MSKTNEDMAINFISHLRQELYTHVFDDNELLEKVEIGINHIVVYPHRTQVGREFLACMVAGMWNPKNHDYFDVYRDMHEEACEAVSFVIDHAGKVYHQYNFMSHNDVVSGEHMHPISAGGYHTHFMYPYDFAGVLALYSVLSIGVEYLINPQSRANYIADIHQLIDVFSKKISHTLLALIDFEQDENLRPYHRILCQISEKGLLSSEDGELLNPVIMQEKVEAIKTIPRCVMKYKNDDLRRILKTFLYEIVVYLNNKSVLLREKNEDYQSCKHPSTIEHLYNLMCCLTPSKRSYHEASDEDLHERLKELSKSQEATASEKHEIEILRVELSDRRFRRSRGISCKKDAQNYDTCQKITLMGEAVPSEIVDNELLGYRSRVIQADNLGFNFSGSNSSKAKIITHVDRPETLKAKQSIGGESSNINISDREFLAATLFIDIVQFFSAQGPKRMHMPVNFWLHVSNEVVHRQKGNKTLMTTEKVHCVIEKNANIMFLRCFNRQSRGAAIRPIHYTRSKKTSIDSVQVMAKWHPASEKEAKVSRDANVFGKLGLFNVLDDITTLKIPKQNAATLSAKALACYGAKLHRVHQNMPYRYNTTLFGIEYSFGKKYIKNYVMDPQLGGGVFIEKHDFAHFFTPLESSCRGGLILARQLAEDNFEFIALEIPIGFCLEIEPGVIHGDSFFQGKYLITLNAEVSADSVLMRQRDDSLLTIEPYVPQQIPSSADHNDILPMISQGYTL